MKRGDVYLANVIFPNDPLRLYVKYFVNVQEGDLFRNAPTISGYFLTTKKLDKLFPTDVFILPAECGNKNGAKIIASQPYTIMKEDLIEYKYTLAPKKLSELDRAIAIGLGLED
jgi:hypothetical protein